APPRGAAGGPGCARAEERGPGVDGCALPGAPRLRVAARGADVVAGRPARAAPGRAAGARAQRRPGSGLAAHFPSRKNGGSQPGAARSLATVIVVTRTTLGGAGTHARSEEATSE